MAHAHLPQQQAEPHETARLALSYILQTRAPGPVQHSTTLYDLFRQEDDAKQEDGQEQDAYDRSSVVDAEQAHVALHGHARSTRR